MKTTLFPPRRTWLRSWSPALCSAILLLANLSRIHAQDFQVATFRILEGSTLTDDCPICARPTLSYPVRGTFDLVVALNNPFIMIYQITNVRAKQTCILK